jgi:hypothetical protein
MCTVSHCHQLLSAQYKYRRCEQHRLQNRYHSKLKRVREKESKAKGPPGVIEVPTAPAHGDDVATNLLDMDVDTSSEAEGDRDSQSDQVGC